jgi:cell division septum initiation protein DivIVA
MPAVGRIRTYEQLILENRQLRERNARLEKTVAELLQRIAEFERTAKRQPAWLHGWVGDEGAKLFAIDLQRKTDVLEKSSASTGRAP